MYAINTGVISRCVWLALALTLTANECAAGRSCQSSYSAISLSTLILVSALPDYYRRRYVMSVRGAMAENAHVGQYDLMPTNFIFMAFYFVLSKGALSALPMFGCGLRVERRLFNVCV